MSKNVKLVTLSVAVVAGLLVAYWGGYQTASIAEPTADMAQVTPDTLVLAQTTQPRASGEQTAPLDAVFDPENVDPDSVDWAAMKARFERITSGDDPMLLRLTYFGDYTQEEIAAFNKLHVIPFNPKVDEVCYGRQAGIDGVGENGDGIVRSCDEIKQFPEHTYASFDLDELVELADHDAAAAVFASRKAKDLPTKIGMTFKAVALSEKSGPLLELKQREFGTIISAGDGRTKEDVLSDLVNRMVLERLADVLGDPRANPDEMRPLVEKNARDAQEVKAVLEAVRNAVELSLKELAEIQREATGSTHIWELTNA